MAVGRWVTFFTPVSERCMHGKSHRPVLLLRDPVRSSEQMRAFAEKAVLAARDSYAKFKDVAESHNGTMEAVFTSASKGASELPAKLNRADEGHTSANLDFAQSLFALKSPSEAWSVDFPARKSSNLTANAQGTRRIGPSGLRPNRRPSGQCDKLFKPAA